MKSRFNGVKFGIITDQKEIYHLAQKLNFAHTELIDLQSEQYDDIPEKSSSLFHLQKDSKENQTEKIDILFIYLSEPETKTNSDSYFSLLDNLLVYFKNPSLGVLRTFIATFGEIEEEKRKEMENQFDQKQEILPFKLPRQSFQLLGDEELNIDK